MESISRFFRNVFRRITRKPLLGDSEVPTYTFYDTIEEFGYHFNKDSDGQLVDDDGGHFNYSVKEDREYNQQHYEALGELITEYLYNKMESDLLLHKVFIPVDATKEEPQGFIFQSSNAEQCQTLMVIITGAGVVRAGQWSRKLIMNEGLEVGSQFPYIRRAQEAGYGVMALNTNQNQQTVNGKAVNIRGSGTAEEHGQYVWEHIIRKTTAANIVIVAHSYGGIVTCAMLDRFLEDFERRVFCVVFTDSVHTVERDRWSQPVQQFLKERAVNFAAAFVPIDYMMQASHPDNCLSVSAGTEDHGRTSHACFDSAFRFIQENHATWTADGSMAPRHFRPLPDDLSEFSCAKRWERMKETEKGAGSNTADKPAPETKKRRAADAQDEESLSKNERTQEDRQHGDRSEDGGEEVKSAMVCTESTEHREEETGGRERKGEELGSDSQEDMDRKEDVDRKEDMDSQEDMDRKEAREEGATRKAEAAVTRDTQEAVTRDTEEAVTRDTEEAVTRDTEEAVTGDTQEAVTGDTQEAVTRDTQAVTKDTEEVVTRDTQEAVTRDTGAVTRDTEAVTRDTGAVTRDTEAVTRDTQEVVTGDTEAAVTRITAEAVTKDLEGEEAVTRDTEEAVTKDAEQAVVRDTEDTVTEEKGEVQA